MPNKFRKQGKSERDLSKDSSEKSFSKDRKVRGSKGPADIDARKEKDTYVKGHNDIKWLTKNDTMAKIVSRVPFGRPIGYPFKLFKTANGVSDVGRKKYIVPGILTIPSLLGAGIAENANSPINQAALGLWVELRQYGTGSLVDDPNDVALYYLSIAQLLAMVGWLRRVVAELSAVNTLNRYVRQGLVYSEGLDYDDLVAHYSEFAFFVAWFAAQVNNFIFPKLDYFDQAYTAFHYIYKDEDSAKAQCYMFTPVTFGKFSPLYDDEGAALIYDSAAFGVGSDYLCPGNNLDFDSLKQKCTDILNVLINDQSTATLSAAVLKAKGAENLWRLTDIDVLHEQVEMVMDAELLMQIHNIQLSRRLGILASSNDVIGYKSKMPTPESGLSPYLITINKTYNPGTHYESLDHGLNMYFDAFTEEPSESEVLLMSRLKSVEELGLVDGENIVTGISEDALVPVAMYKVTLDEYGSFIGDDVPQVQKAIGVATYRKKVTEFQFAPLLYDFGSSDDQDELVGEIHNFTVVEDRVIEDIHLNNLLSLFNVPIHR